ncbi:MAG: hypothetical protein RIR39_80 [Pseudomonadota bacterium]|jgi:hypothetical protein
MTEMTVRAGGAMVLEVLGTATHPALAATDT